MRILALDLGKKTGVADGNGDLTKFRLEAVTLRGTSAEKRVAWFGDWLHERLSDHDLIITESPMNPAASKSADATIGQLYLHGALHAIAAVAGKPSLEVVCAPVMTVRKHFVGQAHASPVHWKGPKRSLADARKARAEINDMVLKRAILLGYLPADSTVADWDKANAAALWDYACAKFVRGIPKELRLFGARA